VVVDKAYKKPLWCVLDIIDKVYIDPLFEPGSLVYDTDDEFSGFVFSNITFKTPFFMVGDMRGLF